MRHLRRSGMFPSLILCSALLLILVPSVRGIDSKCSANVVIAEELWSRLKGEGGKKDLDLTHRLDSKGNRLGRKIAYADSELRYLELLEDLCSKLPETLLLWKTDHETEWMKIDSEEKRAMADKQINKNLKGVKDEMKTELGNHCAGLVDEHEEGLVGVLRQEWDLEKGQGDFMAQFLSKICPDCAASASSERDEL